MELHEVLRFLRDCHLVSMPCVLVTVCAVEGSSMRGPGAIMGVSRDGSYSGSFSGGCIENAVVAEALDTLKAGSPRIVRFGAGSPYLDIKLPCGGGLDLHFQPLSDSALALDCLDHADRREPFSIAVDPAGVKRIAGWCRATYDPATRTGVFGHWPLPRLQLIGHGAGLEALALLARTHGCAIHFLTPDKRIMKQLADRNIEGRYLHRTDETDLLASDGWTATVFLFHDHDWEIDLMARALEQPHFYIGAMGGRRAHAFRKDALRAKGVSDEKLATIHAPIGVFHSSRDPHTLALSTLAEVIRAYQDADFESALG